ncbi:MAG: L-threonylcarbamoyladenylate synthase [Patescibacteria group bacterium]
MRIIKVNLNDDFSEALQDAIAILKSGGVVVYPTDTLYALGANALDPYAIEKVFRVKQRPKNKPLPIAIRNIKWARELAFIEEKEEKVLEAIWPGQVTVVLPKRNIVPDVLTASKKSVAMRVPNIQFVDKLLGKFGYPITSTSANISNELPSSRASEIAERFKGSYYKPDLIIDVGDLKVLEPSTILDLTSDKPKILRVGPTKPEKLLKLLEL